MNATNDTTTTAWEAVDVQHDDEGFGRVMSRTDRLAVPGGWLYRTERYFDHEREDGWRVAVAMVFVANEGDVTHG